MVVQQDIKIDQVKVFEEPWKKSIYQKTEQNLFYFSSSDFVEMKGVFISIYPNKFLKQIMAYTHPVVAIIVNPLFETWQENQRIWLVEGKSEEGHSELGKVGLDECKVLKLTNFKVTVADAFKVAGGAIMKIHDDKLFLNWFLDSIGDRVCKDSSLEMSKLSRKIAERYKDTVLDKAYEYLAVANLAESKEDREGESSRRKKIATAFAYAVFASSLRDKKYITEEVCEKTLTIPTLLPIKVEEDEMWAGYYCG